MGVGWWVGCGVWGGGARVGGGRALEGGCSVPVGVECAWEDSPPGAPESSSATAASEEDTRADDGSKGGNEGYENDDAIPEPEGAEAAVDGAHLTMRAMVVSLDGRECIEGSQSYCVSSDAEAEECAMRMYKQLVEKGAKKILKEITLNRGMIRGQDSA